MDTHTVDVMQDLIETLEDGRKGFAEGAEKLASDGHLDLAATFRELSEQRREFSGQLRQFVANRGATIEEDGSVAAALHRGWMNLKDAIAGSDPDGVLDVAEQGEDHAVAEYEDALESESLTTEARGVVQQQYVAIKAAHDRVKALRDSRS